MVSGDGYVCSPEERGKGRGTSEAPLTFPTFSPNEAPMMYRLRFQLQHSLPLCAALLCTPGIAAHAQNDVLTWHNDNARDGQINTESILSPANVNATNFGLLANVVVDGKVDAQPLYVSALAVNGKGTHNVLFIATEHDSVYAVDADSGVVLWQKSLLGAGETTSDARNCNQVTPEIGITATPAIDRNVGPHGTIYLVAMSKDASGNYYHRIHALDLSTAAEEFNGPVTVHATYPGTGDGSSNGVVTFNPGQYKERPGLLIQNGTLYTSWGSHCDIRPYGGWMMSYNETTLAQQAILDFVPNGSDAAPWNAGAGPAADAAGNVYISLGNGTFDETLNAQGFPGQNDFGNALLKLNGSNLVPLDYWTMYNSDSESSVDDDLGSGGMMLLPDLVDATGTTRQLAVAAGKDHNIYIVDRNNMGHYDASNDGTVYQQLTGSLAGGEWSSPAWWDGRVYYGSVGQNLMSFNVTAAKLQASPTQTTSTSFAYPGTTPSISSYGTTNAIVWATENTSPAVLHAYDATNLATEFYNSNQAANGRDHFGTGNKFITPTIVNGKVYVGTTNGVGIFGFLRQQAPTLADGDYTLTNNSSHFVLDDPYLSTASGTAMYQWTPNGGRNQEWFISSNGSGFYTIQNVSSGLFLKDTTNGTPQLTNNIRQVTPTQDATELWSITSTASGFVIKNKATGLVVDDSDFNTTPGPNIILWTPNGGIHQSWTIQ